MEPHALTPRLRSALRVRGPLGASEVQALLGVSQPTLSRVVRATEGVLVLGRARATRYALRRDIPGVSRPLTVYELGLAATRLGTLHPIEPGGFWMESDGPLSGVYPDLPWFLNDLRPSGFLGRRAPQDAPHLRLPADIRDWTANHVLLWLTEAAADTMGGFILGDAALVRAIEAVPGPPVDGNTADYNALADHVMSQGQAGSSAGGEQPKFLATRRGVPVLVKFSPRVVDAPSARVASLLRCEHIALQTVRHHGIAAAESRIVQGDGRVFLELRRFDRAPDGGRAGMVSLHSVDAEFVGNLGGWSASVAALAAGRHVSPSALPVARWLDQFGAFIGNSDRHAGNLSFAFSGGRIGELAPVYDMLPMHFYPRGGALFDAPHPLPAPEPGFGGIQRAAHAAALEFWSRVLEEVPGEFAALACEAAERVNAMGAVLERLPA